MAHRRCSGAAWTWTLLLVVPSVLPQLDRHLGADTRMTSDSLLATTMAIHSGQALADAVAAYGLSGKNTTLLLQGPAATAGSQHPTITLRDTHFWTLQQLSASTAAANGSLLPSFFHSGTLVVLGGSQTTVIDAAMKANMTAVPQQPAATLVLESIIAVRLTVVVYLKVLVA
jgi:hypothetical protein